jgi:hypothetical protein
MKCFATAISTGVLLYISPMLFSVQFSLLIIPGTIVIFLAIWMYMDNAPPKRSVSLDDQDSSTSTKDSSAADNNLLKFITPKVVTLPKTLYSMSNIS